MSSENTQDMPSDIQLCFESNYRYLSDRLSEQLTCMRDKDKVVAWHWKSDDPDNRPSEPKENFNDLSICGCLSCDIAKKYVDDYNIDYSFIWQVVKRRSLKPEPHEIATEIMDRYFFKTTDDNKEAFWYNESRGIYEQNGETKISETVK